MKQPNLNKYPKFRISAKNLYLTYSQVNKHIDATYILDVMKNKESLPCFNYVIARELHQNGGVHFHVLLTANKKFNITNSSTLDIKYQEHTYHGNYQSVKSLHKVVEYICKDGDYLTDFENITNGKLLTLKEMLINDVKHLGLSQALIKHSENLPNQALANVSLVSADRYFDKLQTLKQSLLADTIETPFKLNDFNLNDNLQRWIDNPQDKTLLLVGDSGIGKTAFCKAFVKHKGFKTLVVNHNEDFKRLDASYDVIIVDDANLDELETTQLLALVDNQVNKTLRVLYTTVFKKANTIQMITMNRQEFVKLFHVLRDKRFTRRILFEQIKQPFIVNLNVNIQINNTNISFGQTKTDEEAHAQQTLDKMNNYFYYNDTDNPTTQ